MKDKVYFSSTDIRYRTGTEGTEVVEDMERETNKVEVTEADKKELEVMEVQNAETGAGTSDAPVKTLPAQTRSILTPRQSSSTYSGASITPIASITPYQNTWTIKARVSSKTGIKTWNKPSGSGKLFSMDLIDGSGEIQVIAFNKQCDAFYDKAVVGKVYYIR